MQNRMSLGLDIGTTSISGIVADCRDGRVLASRTVPNVSAIPGRNPREKMQDPRIIESAVRSLLEDLLAEFPAVASIGITGQMHGIVYLDSSGAPVSPLYTWQDQRSAELCPRLKARTGYEIAPGYGLATHCALLAAGEVPEGAKQICTVMDYIGAALCGLNRPCIHATNAASLGFFRVRDGIFDEAALCAAGVDAALLPPVTAGTECLGAYRGIPVAVAIGDNQASFLGAVSDPDTTALANFGTGSQISAMTRSVPEQTDRNLELRPFVDGAYLLCGSALCGGRAYALLERFFRSFTVSCGLPEEERYAVLNVLAQEGLKEENLPTVTTTFCGTRAEPEKKGAVAGLTEDNFTPQALTAGLLRGMARELWELFQSMPDIRVDTLAASGNAIRKNPALRTALEQVFGLPVRIPRHREEGAFGAAMFAWAAVEKTSIRRLAKDWIRWDR